MQKSKEKKTFKSNVALGSFLKHMQDKAHQNIFK